MTTTSLSLGHLARCAALVSAIAGQPAMAQQATPDGSCIARLTPTQQRLYQKAGEGTDALRRFIFIRRAILQVDTYETAIWAAALSQARAACRNTAADGDATDSPLSGAKAAT